MSVSLPRRQDRVVCPPPRVFFLLLLTPMSVSCCQPISVLEANISLTVRVVITLLQIVVHSAGFESSRPHTLLPGGTQHVQGIQTRSTCPTTSRESKRNGQELTKCQACRHKPRSRTANSPRSHTPTGSPTLRSCTSRPGECRRASPTVDRRGSRVRRCLTKRAPRRLAGEWRRECEPPGGVVVGVYVALDVKRGGRWIWGGGSGGVEEALGWFRRWRKCEVQAGRSVRDGRLGI